MEKCQTRAFNRVLPLMVLFLLCACPQTADTPKSEASGAQAPGVGKEQAATKQTLTVYCGRKKKLIGTVLDGFQAANPNIDLKVKYAGTAQLAATLAEEGEKSPADVFIAQDASTLAVLEGQKRFALMDEAVSSRVSDGFKSATNSWLGFAGRSRVLAYNKEKLKPSDLPKNVDELTTKKWEGRVGWAPENASFQSFVAAMLQLRGPDKTKAWLKGMKANQPKGFPSNTPAVLALSRGEIDVALTNHYYLYRLKSEYGDAFPVENHFFNQADAASMVNIAGVGILKSSQNQKHAQALVNYLLSAEVQAKLVKQNHEFPIVASVAPPQGLPPISELKTPAINLADLDDLKQTISLLRETGTLP